MKKVILIITALALAAGFSPVFAARDGEKGADQSAYEHAGDNAVFNRVGDWFATVGKSEEEKAKIIEERKARRAAKRAEKEARKAEQQASQEAERMREREQERSREIKQETEQQQLRRKPGQAGGFKGGKGK